MSQVMETLKSQLAALPNSDRAELAQFLIESLGPGAEEGSEAAWEEELTRRVAEIRSGEVVGKSADEVFAELRKRFS